MCSLFTGQAAREYAACGCIEEWIHCFLRAEGNNIPFSDGLKLEKRRYIGPVSLPLRLLQRCCGPEEGLKYIVDEAAFEQRVESIRQRLQNGWDMPPLIVNFADGALELTDGNHRYEAAVRTGMEQCDVIIWTTGTTDHRQFVELYNHYC